MIITIDNNIRIPLTDLPPGAADEIKARMTFSNPEYWKAKARLKSMGRVNSIPRGSDKKPIPEVISQWQEKAGNLLLPRGVISELITMFPGTQVIDMTRRLPNVEFKFLKNLRPYQQEATTAMLARRFGTLICPTGGGKTVMGTYAIAIRKQPTCIVVHTNKLLRQWAERIAGSKDHDPQLDVRHDEIGYIAEGNVKIGKRITIALVQTLRKHIYEVRHHFGHFLFDECHHLPAEATFHQVATACDSYFFTGVTATPKRADGKSPLIFWNLGPIVHEVSYSRLVREGWILLPTPIIRQTSFQSNIGVFNVDDYNDLQDEQKQKIQRERAVEKSNLITELIHDSNRNNMIRDDIILELANGGGPCLILSDRTDHCDLLGKLLNNYGIPTGVSHGKLKRKEQNIAEMALRHGKVKVLAATGQLLGEGFDEAVPSALFLVTPLSFSERLKQYLGRIGRPAEDKAAKVYDYQDIHCEPLMRSARERMRTYKALIRLAKGPTPKEK